MSKRITPEQFLMGFPLEIAALPKDQRQQRLLEREAQIDGLNRTTDSAP